MSVVLDKPIHEVVEEYRSILQTPYYLLDESRLLQNLEKIQRIRERTGAKALLALKCFSTWSVFDLMRPYMDGTTSSSLFEARLGHEKFGGETHAYSAAFSDEDMEEIPRYATKVIFNSISQLTRYGPRLRGMPLGLRVNPGVSHSEFDLADPARRYCRLGERNLNEILEVSPLIQGAMFHCQCENDDFQKFCAILDHIGKRFEPLLRRLQWVSLGGGIYFTKEGYPLERFCEKLSEFSRRFSVQLYLEPGETAITQSGFLVTKVLDIVHNEVDIAIVDAAVETHMLDLLIYGTPAKMARPQGPGHTYQIAGNTCLAGDVFGTYTFPEKLRVGDLIPFADAAGYTMVKKNWFNGVRMPSIAVRRLDGRLEVVRRFDYEDYLTQLS